MNNIHLTVAEVLLDIEKELRNLQLWNDAMISEEALASEQPFAVDTMTFPQWLQFIFLPRMYYMVEQRMQLPRNCGIAPMAEEYFAVFGSSSFVLVSHLRKIDQLLNEGARYK
jgi:uncharacterized protein YqcC (DUF446 family)